MNDFVTRMLDIQTITDKKAKYMVKGFMYHTQRLYNIERKVRYLLFFFKWVSTNYTFSDKQKAIYKCIELNNL